MARDFELESDKIIKWKHIYPNQETQQIALSFNDEVALFNAW